MELGMIDLTGEYLPYLLVALLVGAVVGFLLLRPRQRVRLSDATPMRPHMAHRDSPREANDILSEAAAATGDVAGEIICAPVHQHLGEDGDNFQRMKGVGPKFADMLAARGFTRFEQLASLTSEEIDRLDPELGPFRGRLKRDRIVEQAHYLARRDQDGFEQTFGKL
jgi:predicted flap endonuclease-1-like 5' DNA nuclease